ncbi:hypothetical protein E8K88_02525 [Lampropedia aestuarii]|uniref:Uncharacterized protein n=1 Tax=Lampropedia aestuarii TaxID=2562762 RepID=A0A4S5BUJ1_9BURK|nr:hypothetical protein [Lampropedia aestuarii]THJ36159.1 hypothetical protein E8K88_02525 [Lampropedia aestuarii]
MADTRLMPLAGINNRAEDAALVRGGDSPAVWVREALNVDITETGRLNMRGQVRAVTQTPYKHLWFSALHGDLFGVLGTRWVKIHPDDWSYEELADLGGSWASHCVIDQRVAVAGADGIFVYDGTKAEPLQMHTPGMPAVSDLDGSLPPGDYGVAVSWLRGSLESSVSEVAFGPAQSGGLRVSFPFSLDDSVTGVRLYMTKPGSRELQRVGDYLVSAQAADVVAPPALGGSPEFQHLDAMPSGRFMHHWRGRLLTCTARTLHFSKPMAVHLHDCRHDFVQLPQRITFVAPVEGGIWVGQVDHIVFLSGTQPDDLVVRRLAGQPPIQGSATLVPAEQLGELAGGNAAALWLSANGYVVGTSEGEIVELHRTVLTGIAATAGATVLVGERLLTVLQPA